MPARSAASIRILSLAASLLVLAGCGDLSDANAEAGAATSAPASGEAEVGQADRTSAGSAARTPIADPYRRADASFSRYPLEEETTPQAIGRLTNGDVCDDGDILCEWEDENGVRHIMGGDVLAIKIIAPPAGDERAIGALGIGTARQRGQVLKNVREFLPEIEITCLTEDESGEGDGLYSCGGHFAGGAWIKLIFDTNDYLVSARIDAFQIN